MGKFKDKHGHSRWQEARQDVKNYIGTHESAMPILKAIVKIAVPRAGSVIEAIEEVKASKLPQIDKVAINKRLDQLLEDLDEDGVPDSLQSSTDSTDFPGKKFITPILLVVVMANYFHLQLCTMYNWAPVAPDQMELAGELMWSSIGLWQGGRILNNVILNKKK